MSKSVEKGTANFYCGICREWFVKHQELEFHLSIRRHKDKKAAWHNG